MRTSQHTAALVTKALVKKQGCQEMAERTATLTEVVLTEEQSYHAAAEQTAVSADTSLTDKQRYHEVAEHAVALAEDKGHQVDDDAAQHQVADDQAAVLVEPHLGNMAIIEHIWTVFALCAAPLDTNLAGIAWEETAQTASAPLMTPSAHPAAMLSSPPCPKSYVGAVQATTSQNLEWLTLNLLGTQ
jgi:hypothetical protein